MKGLKMEFGRVEPGGFQRMWAIERVYRGVMFRGFRRAAVVRYG